MTGATGSVSAPVATPGATRSRPGRGGRATSAGPRELLASMRKVRAEYAARYRELDKAILLEEGKIADRAYRSSPAALRARIAALQKQLFATDHPAPAK